MMMTEYQPGSYCNDVDCANLKALISLGAAEYLIEKSELCRDCGAWNFYVWLRTKNCSITTAGSTATASGSALVHGSSHWADPDTEESSALRARFT
ncbi:MAG: hypothetical protein AB2L13_11390 [Spirochaetota bacterium]|jgi:hypothetical protein